ncbi:DUF4956 domain-containing protein [Carboxylicivirga sp. RSCT41]|uniref:DUF4956 domain-containing protein n=1 Tax=Carboxylicivirga agarovorans TaxID=3417570 RepID=UPI003D3515B0
MTEANVFYFEFHEVLIRFVINLLVILLITWIRYRENIANRQFAPSFIMMGISIFLTCSYLGMVKVELGIVLGLFAVFSILRFRTKNVPFYEMVNLFVIISTSAINALANFPNVYRGLIVCNSIVIVATFFLEIYRQRAILNKREMVINEIHLLAPIKEDELLVYLKETTALNVKHVEIINVNNVKKEARIIIYYL